MTSFNLNKFQSAGPQPTLNARHNILREAQRRSKIEALSRVTSGNSNSDFKGVLEKDDSLGKGGTQTSQMPPPRTLSIVASGNSIHFDFQGGLEKAGPRYSSLLELK